jgi:hypothetical protein
MDSSSAKPPVAAALKKSYFGLLVGLGMFAGAGWLFVDSLLDCRAFPSEPKPMSVAEAIAKADPGRGAWVKLTDLRLPCAIAASNGTGSGGSTYRLGTGPTGNERLVVAASGPLPCSDAAIELVGELDSSRPGRIAEVEFPGNDWSRWPTPYQITLWTNLGPDNTRLGLWLTPPFALMGLFIALLYLGIQSRWLAAGFLAVAGAFLLVVSVSTTGDEIRSLRSEREVWASGITLPGVHGDAKEVTRKAVFHELKVSLLFTHDGTPHTATLTSQSLFWSATPEVPFEVRIDPHHPDRVASSWTSAVRPGRVLLWIVYSSIGFTGIVVLWLALKAFRRARGGPALEMT